METVTQTPDLGARRRVWNGLAAREGAKKRAYGGKQQAYTETITQTPDHGERRAVWDKSGCIAARRAAEKGALKVGRRGPTAYNDGKEHTPERDAR